jgi:hypothetical protein
MDYTYTAKKFPVTKVLFFIKLSKKRNTARFVQTEAIALET